MTGRWPSEVAATVGLFGETMMSSGALGVLLVGSASTGELYSPPPDEPGLSFGDLEFYVLARDASAVPSLSGVVATTSWGGSRPVHASVVTEESLAGAGRTFRLFEAKQRGHPVAGRDLRPLIPQIDLTNLDFGDLNDILLWRAADLAAAWTRSGRDRRQPRLTYAACKNLLDVVTTWFGPHAGVLEAGFANRLRRIPKAPLRPQTAFVVEAIAKWGDVALAAKTGRRPLSDVGDEIFPEAVAVLATSARLVLTRDDSLRDARFSDRRLRRRTGARLGLVRAAARREMRPRDVLATWRRPHATTLQRLVAFLESSPSPRPDPASALAPLVAIFPRSADAAELGDVL